MLIKKIIPYSLLLLLGYFTYQIFIITKQYYPIQDEVGFLRIKQEYISILHWKIAFFIHVFSSIFVLIAGFTQFLPYFLQKYPKIHRIIGIIYVFDILLITGPASFIMSLYANGGLPSRIGFTLIAILWIYFTFRAYQAAYKRQFLLHKNFMIRSYALTLSAVTLRAWKWLIVLLFAPRPLDVYMLVTWLGFIPNLFVAEWIIRKKGVF